MDSSSLQHKTLSTDLRGIMMEASAIRVVHCPLLPKMHTGVEIHHVYMLVISPGFCLPFSSPCTLNGSLQDYL